MKKLLLLLLMLPIFASAQISFAPVDTTLRVSVGGQIVRYKSHPYYMSVINARAPAGEVVKTSSVYNNPNWLLSFGYNKLEGVPSVFPTNKNLVLGLNSTLDSIRTVLNGKQAVGNYLTAINSAMVISALGYDPATIVPNYAKSLTGFSVIKSSTDALYQPIGNYLTSFTETDPNVSAYAKSLTGFSVIQAATDPLYRPITYVTSWAEIPDKPTTFAPSPHSHTAANITDLASVLSSYQLAIPSASINNWNTAYGWGNHTGLYSLLGHTHTPSQVGLGNVNNTSDADKPVSSAVQTALNVKQNTITLTTTGTGVATLTGSTLNIPTPNTGIRVFVSTATVGQSRSQLNTAYPTANVGDMVLVPGIVLGGAIYVKSGTSGGGTWQSISAPPVL